MELDTTHTLVIEILCYNCTTVLESQSRAVSLHAGRLYSGHRLLDRVHVTRAVSLRAGRLYSGHRLLDRVPVTRAGSLRAGRLYSGHRLLELCTWTRHTPY